MASAVALGSISSALMAQDEGTAEQDTPSISAADAGSAMSFSMREQTLVYGTFTTPQRHSPFNPDNRLAAISSREMNADLRLDLSARAGKCDASAKVRGGYDYVVDANPQRRDDDHGELFLNAGNVRCQVAEGWYLSAGREVLQWGSAFFLSPSNPLFSDTGRTNPLSDLYGKDIAQLTWHANERLTFSVLHNYDVGSRDPDPLNFSSLTAAKVDWIGDAASGGAILSKRGNGVTRLGLYGTYTYSDALILYADVAFGQGNAGWFPVQDAGDPQWRFARSKLHDEGISFTSLVGGSYTFESGWSLTGEWLTGNEGYSRGERDDYLAAVTQAAAGFSSGGPQVGPSAQVLGTALANGLPYLGSDYLFLQVQRSEWHDKADVALRWTRALGAGSGDAFSASATYYFTPSLQGFLIGTRAFGGADGDFGRLLEDSALVGLRWYF